MPLIARGTNSAIGGDDASGGALGPDIVNTGHPVCVAPGQIKTDTASPDVYVENFPAHRKDDLNQPHTHCPPVYGTPITTHSPNVFVNNKEVARQGDSYSCGAFVETVTQSTVYANG
jgi:uncharacterized Zn-binding protein involved in type VI secretion